MRMGYGISNGKHYSNNSENKIKWILYQADGGIR